MSTQLDDQSRHEPLKVLQGASMPVNGLRSQKPKIYSGVVPCFDNEAGEHSNSGAVQKIQFPQVKYDRFDRFDQCALEQVEDGSIIFHTGQAQRTFEYDGRIVVFQLDVKRFPFNVFHAETPSRFSSG